jgi:hypothetical protein
VFAWHIIEKDGRTVRHVFERKVVFATCHVMYKGGRMGMMM